MISEKHISKAHRILTVVFALVSLVYGYYRNEESLFWTLVKIIVLNVAVQVFYYAISLAPLSQLNWMGKENILYKTALAAMRLFSVGVMVMGLFVFFTSIQNLFVDIESLVTIFLSCFVALGALSLNKSLQKLS